MIYLPLNAARSVGSEFADAVTKIVNRYCSNTVDSKVKVVGKDSYKITWWYNDSPFVDAFVAYAEDEYDYENAIENDNVEYDYAGEPILPEVNQERLRSKKTKPTPEKFLKTWDESGRFRLFCLNYGFTQDKKLRVTVQQEELGGPGGWHKTDFHVHFITGYVTQNVPQYQVDDTAWIIKCIDSLLRDGLVFKDGKKVRVNQEDRKEWTGGPITQVRRKGNVIKLQKVISGLWKDEPTTWENIDEDLEKIRQKIHRYYPDFLDHLVFDTNGSSITIKVL